MISATAPSWLIWAVFATTTAVFAKIGVVLGEHLSARAGFAFIAIGATLVALA